MPFLFVGASLSLAACGKDPGPKGDPGPQGPAGPQGAQGIQGVSGTQGQTGSRVLKGRRALLAKKEKKRTKAIKVKKAIPARETREIEETRAKKVIPVHQIRVVQLDGLVACESTEVLVSVFCPNGGVSEGAKCTSAPTVGLCFKKQ